MNIQALSGNELHKLLQARETLALDERLLWERLETEDRKDVENDIEKDLIIIAETIPDLRISAYLNTNLKYGIQTKNLKQLHFGELKDIFYGINNIDVPHVMGINLNEAELLALYLGIGKIKRRNGNNLIEFYTSIKQINSEGYKSRNIGKTKKEGNNPHTMNTGDLITRMQIMPDRIRKQFLESYNEQFKRSYQEEESSRYIVRGYFYDSNWDGKDKSLYVRDISRILETKYKKAEQKHLEEMKIISMKG